MMADEAKLKTLKAKRGGHKAYATKLTKDIHEYINGVDRAESKIITFSQVLTDRHDIIKVLGDEILSELVDEKQIEQEIMTAAEYELKIQET